MSMRQEIDSVIRAAHRDLPDADAATLTRYIRHHPILWARLNSRRSLRAYLIVIGFAAWCADKFRSPRRRHERARRRAPPGMRL